jgi:hypothetical protein
MKTIEPTFKQGEEMFNSADYYTVDDVDTLTYTTPEDALEEWLDLIDADDVEAWIQQNAPITVTAYKRDAVSDAWYLEEAKGLADTAENSWWETYGDPYDTWKLEANPKVRFRNTLAKEIEAVLRRVVGAAEVWICSPCGEREYSAVEILELWYSLGHRPRDNK